jgi:hypothetical protein
MRYSKWVILALTLALMLVPLSTYAFDGQRKGFVMGFGCGYSPWAKWSRDNPSLSETGQGLDMRIPLGYAWSNQNMLVYEGAPTFFKSNDDEHSCATQGVWGIRWYHYFAVPGRTWFLTLGVGRAVFIKDEEMLQNGVGVVLGGGYEFTKHLQAGLYYAGGRCGIDDYHVRHHALSLVVTALVY